MPVAGMPGKAVDTVHTLQPTNMALEYDHDPSNAPAFSNQADAALSLSLGMTPTPQLRYADREDQYARP